MTALVAPPIPMQSALSLSLRIAIAVQSAIASTFGFTRSRPDRHPLAQRPDPQRHAKSAASSSTLRPTPPQPPHPQPSATPSSASASTSTTSPSPPTSTPSPPRSAANSTSTPRPSPASPSPPPSSSRLDDELRALATDNLNLQPATCPIYSTWITGKRVRVEPPRDPIGAAGYTGTTAGLDPSGFLLVSRRRRPAPHRPLRRPPRTLTCHHSAAILFVAPEGHLLLPLEPST